MTPFGEPHNLSLALMKLTRDGARRNKKCLSRTSPPERLLPMHLFACGSNGLHQLLPEETILSEHQPKRNVKRRTSGESKKSPGSTENEVDSDSDGVVPMSEKMMEVVQLAREQERVKNWGKLPRFREILKDLQIKDEFGDGGFDKLQVVWTGWGQTVGKWTGTRFRHCYRNA